MQAHFDLIAIDKSWVDILLRVPALPGHDQKVVAEPLGRCPGGGGGNVACAASRLGLRAGMVSWVGDDTDGQLVLDDLRRFGVDTSHIAVKPGAPTNFTVVLIDPSGEKAIVIAPTTFDTLHLDAPLRAYLRAAHIVYSTTYDLEQLAQVAAVVRDAGGLLAADIEPATVPPDERLRHALSLVDIAFLNATAFDPKEAAEMAGELCAAGPRVVVLTFGAHGAFACTDRQVVRHPAFSVPVVDTTGAGDCFAAAFMAAYLRRFPLEHALVYAQAAAALSIQAHGARGGLPTHEDVLLFAHLHRDPSRFRGTSWE